MATKGKTRSKGKRIKKVKKLPKNAEANTIYEIQTKKGRRYFEGTNRELLKPVKKPK